MNEFQKYYIKDLEIENQMLLLVLIITLIFFSIVGCCYVSKIQKLEKQNAKLEQQVIDYKWQLDQVQYVLEYQRGE